MDAPQLEFDFVNAPEARSGRVVFAKQIDLGSFGNLSLLFVVDGSTVREVSLLECDDPSVSYYNYLS